MWCLPLHPVTELGFLWFLSDGFFSARGILTSFRADGGAGDRAKLPFWLIWREASQNSPLRDQLQMLCFCSSQPVAEWGWTPSTICIYICMFFCFFFNQIVSIMQKFPYSPKSWTLEKLISPLRKKTCSLSLFSLPLSCSFSLHAMWCKFSIIESMQKRAEYLLHCISTDLRSSKLIYIS